MKLVLKVSIQFGIIGIQASLNDRLVSVYTLLHVVKMSLLSGMVRLDVVLHLIKMGIDPCPHLI